VEAYKYIACFKAGPHHMYVQEKIDPNQQCLPMHYMLIEKYIRHIVNDWDEEWRTPM
jgi:hypothetical protein